MRFRAFLSHSHADAAWARWLLRRLETYRVPSNLVGTRGAHGIIERRLGSFFRDRDELPSSGDLGATIREALSDSAALVVVCSPAAARSRWVDAEIAGFLDSGRVERVLCFVVDGVPGSDDPELACFPPRLLQPDADGVVREPLAADARREGDGRERAFLKLVAGLLGVGFDALAQREAQRRTRRMAIVAAASLAGMAIALALAATAWVARNDAQRRQAQAEDLLGFMLGDLRDKLTTVGRLDLMRAVDDKATGYFATLDPRDLTDRALEEQARSLAGIGEVRLGGGDHDAAMAAFTEAHERSTALYQRAPGDGQRLFDLAQAEYWIGFVAWQQGRLDDAEVWLVKYRDSATALAAMDPGNFDWQREVSYGHHNLAVLDEGRGRYAQAEAAMHKVLEMLRAWSAERPDDLELRGESADTMSWLGGLATRQGRLAEAEALFAEEVAAISRNLAQDPLNAWWRTELSRSTLFLVEAQLRRGRPSQAGTTIAAIAPHVQALSAQDPSNLQWLAALGKTRLLQAHVATTTDPALAGSLAAEAVVILANAHEKAPENQRNRNQLVRAHQFRARLALVAGDATDAHAHISASAALIDPEWASRPGEPLRQLLAENLVLSGEQRHATGDFDGARDDWLKAEALLQDDGVPDLPFDRLEPLVRVLHHLGRVEQATVHRQRLDAAGHVPSWPWPTPQANVVARTHPSTH